MRRQTGHAGALGDDARVIQIAEEQIVQQRRRSRVRMMEMHAGGTLSAPVRTGVVDIGAAQEARRIDQAEEFMR